MSQSCGGAPRGERPDRKGRRDASLVQRLDVPAKARPGASKDRSTPAFLGAPLPLARPQVRGERGKGTKDYGAAGAAKHTAGGAMPVDVLMRGRR